MHRFPRRIEVRPMEPDFTFTRAIADLLKLVSAVGFITILVVVIGAFAGALS